MTEENTLGCSYLHEVRKEKYECTSIHEEPVPSDTSNFEFTSLGWESLQDLNDRFARYINRARVLEQHNAIFRKQLETLHRLEEASDLEEVFAEHINLNRRRITELAFNRTKLERDLKDAERALDEHQNRYRSECEYQQQLRSTLEQLNKEADTALLRNLELQIQSQFLQDDVSCTKERHRKNFAEIQTYINILRQIDQATPRLSIFSSALTEEKCLAQRHVPTLRAHLEEYKSALCQLQSEKQRLRSETAVLEQLIRGAQESYDGDIQLCNERIETLRRDTEEAERALEKYSTECARLDVYHAALQHELDRYKRVIENEDSRLNLAISGSPVSFSTRYQCQHTPLVISGGPDLTVVVQDIAKAKAHQKVDGKKVVRKKDISSLDKLESRREGLQEEEEQREEEEGVLEKLVEKHLQHQDVIPDDVPDGSQISRGFSMLRDFLRGQMRKYKTAEVQPEPEADIYTSGRYVVVTGERCGDSPFFLSFLPSAGHVLVSTQNGAGPFDDEYERDEPGPTPSPQPVPLPLPLTPSIPPEIEEDEGKRGKGRQDDQEKEAEEGNDGKGYGKGDEPLPEPHHHESDPTYPSGHKGHASLPGPSAISLPITSPSSDYVSYEKVEVMESKEMTSSDNRVKGYEETSMSVETMVEKVSRKKH